MGNDNFWDKLVEGSNSLFASSIDSHFSDPSDSFVSVRGLTDKMRSANALRLPVEAGTKVVFAGGMGAYLSYEDCPSEGSVGEVVKVRSAAGDITHHDGKVFVQWNDGKFRGIHAEHLRLASSGKTPWIYMSNSQRQRAAKHWTKERELAEHVWEDPSRLKEVIISAARDGLVWDGKKYVPDVFDPKRHVMMKRVAFSGADPDLPLRQRQEQAKQIMDALSLLAHHRVKPKVSTNPEGWTIVEIPATTSMSAAYIENHLDEQLGRRTPFTVESGGSKVYVVVGEDERNQRSASDLKSQFEKVKNLAKKKPDNKFLKGLLKQMADEGFSPTDKQMKVVKEIEEEAKQQTEMKKELKSLKSARRIRVSSLGDLTQFLKRADGKLIHKSTNDLWSYSKDADGNFLVERLFDGNGEPLKG